MIPPLSTIAPNDKILMHVKVLYDFLIKSKIIFTKFNLLDIIHMHCIIYAGRSSMSILDVRSGTGM